MGKRGKTGDEWQDILVLAAQARRRGYGTLATDKAVGYVRHNVRLLFVAFVTLISILVARLMYLQIFEGGTHTLMASTNHLERIREPAPRGIIYDRNGVELVKNVPRSEGGFTRDYILGATASITGYIAEVTQDELGCHDGLCNEPGMFAGRTGLEKVFESTLRGRDGGRLVEVNASGAEVRELGTNVPETGTDLHTTIDSRLQRIAQDAMGDRTGSVVALDLQGKVLAIVSTPSYDPNLFTVKRDDVRLQSLLKDDIKQYFLDRPIAGIYPPGSVFKLVTAYAGLETGKIQADTLIEDTGEIRIDQYRYGNWFFDQYGSKEGEITVTRALARSNDIFFYKVGEQIGINELVGYAEKFGYGEKTGIELPGESAGLVPTPLWKERRTGEKWFLGNTYHMSIGQGDLLVTPLQVARATAASISGRLCRVSLLRDTSVTCDDLGLKNENIETVKQGMKEVCQQGGTAFPFFEFTPWVLCKTGTAQHAGQNPSAGSGSKGNEVKPHAWITVAYPGENPEMVLVVMLDSAGEGSYEAGPVAKEILEKWSHL